MAWDIIAGALGLGGSLYAGSANRKAASAAQQKQIDFEKWKLSNYHQQEVMDLRKAGLNPMLSVQHATPVGGVAAPYGEQDNPGESGIRSYSAAKQARIAQRQQSMQEALAESQMTVNSATAERELKQADLYGAQTGAVPADIELKTSSALERREAAKAHAAQVELNRAQLYESAGRLRQLQKELEVMQQRINESKTHQGAMIARSRYDDARAAYAVAQTEHEQIRKAGTALENQARELGIPEKQIRAETAGGFRQWYQGIAETVADVASSANEFASKTKLFHAERNLQRVQQRKESEFREWSRQFAGKAHAARNRNNQGRPKRGIDMR